jgi:hypothetical protein
MRSSAGSAGASLLTRVIGSQIKGLGVRPQLKYASELFTIEPRPSPEGATMNSWIASRALGAGRGLSFLRLVLEAMQIAHGSVVKPKNQMLIGSFRIQSIISFCDG